MSGRSQTDLLRWGVALLKRWGLQGEHGIHIVVWAHDDWCPCHPHQLERRSSDRCECRPDGTLVLHAGTTRERGVDVVRNGVPLAVRGLDEETPR